MSELYTIETTPIQKLNMEEFPHNLYIKRDDLIGFSFGGNKVRLILEFFKDMRAKGGNCMVAYGSAKSNLCRAAANLCSSQNVPCYIVTSLEDEAERAEGELKTFNSCLVKQFGAFVRYCRKSQTAETIGNLLEELKEKGLRPYYIYGDCLGRGNEKTAALAYERAYGEIQNYEREQDILFDYIFLASGTGMTQGGLLAGQALYGGKCKIVGISIARNKKNGIEGVERFQNRKKGLEGSEIYFLDEYLAGGYGVSNEGIRSIIRRMMTDYGIPMDATYVGKAFYGMMEFMKKEKQGQNVLFLHTGGTPLYFDELCSYED